MQATPPRRSNSNRARTVSWARLWLACIATLLTCAGHLLPPSLQRRLPLLDLPSALLARLVARLILICALERATPPKHALRAQMMQAGAMRALLRTGVQRHLTNTHGAFDLAQIARTCANPEPAIADMIAVLECGLTRRRPTLARAAHEALIQFAPGAVALICDTS